MRVFDFLLFAQPLQKQLFRSILRRAWTNQRQCLRYFFKCPRLHRAQQPAHCRRFDLKHSHRSSICDNLARRGIVFRYGVKIDLPRFGARCHSIRCDVRCISSGRGKPRPYRSKGAFDVVQCQRHGGEAALAEEIHLDQAERFDGVHVVLRHDDAFRRPLERRQPVERARGNHRAAGMNPEMPWRVVEPQRHLQDRFPGLVVHGKVAAFRQAVNRR